MKGLLTYSAVSAKLAGMRGKLLTGKQYRELIASGSVPAAAEYLKGLDAYREAFADADALTLRRAEVERLLTLSLYRDYSRLYRFSGQAQRRFLDLYFMHFEVDILKRCLRDALSDRASELDLSSYDTFFRRHSKLDLTALADCTSLSAFIDGLKGSCYEKPLKNLFENGVTARFDYETALDTVYFLEMWKVLHKDLKASERDAVSEAIGEKIDLLNLDWLSRAKQHYKLSADAIREFLIPITGRLKKEELDRMAEAADFEEFLALTRTTRYREKLPEEETPDFSLLLETVYRQAGRKNPYSAAAINSFFYFKEREIQRIITAVEGIRYHLDGTEILAALHI